MKEKILKSFLIVLLIMCLTNVVFADVVTLLTGHGGFSIIFYELSWAIIAFLIFGIIYCSYKIAKQDTKKIKKYFIIIFVVGVIGVCALYVSNASGPVGMRVDDSLEDDFLYRNAERVLRQYSGNNKSASVARACISHTESINNNLYEKIIIYGISDLEEIKSNKKYSIELLHEGPYDRFNAVSISEYKSNEDN